VKLYFGIMEIRLGDLQVSLSSFEGHFRLILLFLADSVLLKERSGAHMLAPRPLKLGLCLRKNAPGPLESYFIGHGVYLKELGSLFHELAFLKDTLLQDAAHAGAYLNFKKPCGLADELGRPVCISGFNMYNFHKRWGRCFF
jgi:hypothetical protein